MKRVPAHLICPHCQTHGPAHVTDTSGHLDGRSNRRRRECLACGERFTTFETVEIDWASAGIALRDAATALDKAVRLATAPAKL